MDIGRTFGCAALVAASLAAATASADDFYKGKTIQFIIGSSPGGGFDTDGRIIARHIGDALPGAPAVVPQNMPGAGSIRAADYLYFTAPKDGTVIGVIDPGVYNSQLLGEPRIRFDAANFTWLGRMVNNSPLLFTWHTSPIKTASDLFTKEAIIAASGPTPRLNYLLLNTVLHSRIKIISGYPGSAEAMLAMERGEIHGLSMPWPVIKATKPEWIRQKSIIPILQTGAEKHPELSNVPRMIDLTKNDEDRKLFEFFALPSQLGRSAVAPPDLPTGRAQELRAAFWKMVHDPQFLADAAKIKLDIAPLTGEQLQALFQGGHDFSPKVIARAKDVWKLSQKEDEKNQKK
jgi:tripartite-type tricarboxylate transporter receptor subunit TctC